MNKLTKAIAAIMLMMVVAVGCNKPDEPINGGNDGLEAPIVGLFSINDSTQVRFSSGNLQYQASTDTWHFSENQWDYIGEDNANISETYDGWIDLFGWGTGDKPTYTSTHAYDTAYLNFVDWGMNSINNGMGYQWYALNDMEWHYLLASRDTESGIRYAAATVNGIKGLILLPDNWDASIYTFVGYNYNESTFDTHVITASQWKTLEMHGAIFLPAAGMRNETRVERVQDVGMYWAAGQPGLPIWGYVYYVQFYGGEPCLLNYCGRGCGLSVRLVRDAE